MAMIDKQLVIEHLKLNKTMKQVADELGITRNQVAGISYRHKHAAKKKPKLPSPMKMKTTGKRVAGSKNIKDLKDNECRYSTTPHGVAPDKHRFCAKPVMGRSPYCLDHHQLCRESSNERKGKNKVYIGGSPLRLSPRFGSLY